MMYDKYIEEHALDIDQFTALLSAVVNPRLVQDTGEPARDSA